MFGVNSFHLIAFFAGLQPLPRSDRTICPIRYWEINST